MTNPTNKEVITELNELEQVRRAEIKHLDVAKDCFTRGQDIQGKTHIQLAIAQFDREKVRLEYLL